ncbi:DUF760 domain-containing protein [Phormidium sp. CCY1219]|uniref:DUF760 domain-containing protein n=1 Tax=Phormidium sp. CCY1219 TaxID=2886104 RepID=UPI002D1F6E82|nr:DUF760 domain-containing protein [Phormidium sp. CCY1219]MEB3830599.1 DUF760 domain-containing protein [Phormidium sp. CCY1219]
MVYQPDFFNSNDDNNVDANSLLDYLQHQPPEVLARVAKSVSPEIKEIISQNVQGLVGVLPSENFEVQVTTNRENLAGLLASAMMTGYFLHKMEQRMHLDEHLSQAGSLNRDAGGADADSDGW